MAYIVDYWEDSYQFSGAQTQYNKILNQTRTLNSGDPNIYVYLGFGQYTSPSDLSYTITDSSYYWGQGGTRHYEIPWTDGTSDGYASLNVAITDDAGIFGPHKSFEFLNADMIFPPQDTQVDKKCSFYICFSTNDYTNSPSTLFNHSDVIVYVFTLFVYNPPKISQTYPIAFLNGSTQITTSTITYTDSRDTTPFYPNSVTITGCQNATQMGVSNPGYRGIGWDTSSSATQVVYGSKDPSGSFTIPANTLPNNTNYNLYAVWEKALNLKVIVGGQPKTVSRVAVVTSISGTTATMKDIYSGKVYNGTTWKDL